MTDKEEQSLTDVIAYAVDQEKTNGKSDNLNLDNEDIPIMQQYVSGVNCTPMTARSEMLAVKSDMEKTKALWHFTVISLLHHMMI